jgi:hypothetical protein
VRILSALFVMITASSSYADTYRLICENPRREYTISYTDGDRAIQASDGANETPYTVLAVEETEEKHVVAAQTPNGGPSVRMNLRPYLRMEYWMDGQLFQTDACRLPG